jgi:hypothetical protein
MEILLIRQKPTQLSIPGEMTILGVHECWTLENRDLSIAPGRFPISLHPTPKFAAFVNHLPPEWDKTVPLLHGTEPRTSIEIHPGNFPSDFHGCIGVGMTHAVDFVGASGVAFMALWHKTRIAIQTEEVWITIAEEAL